METIAKLGAPIAPFFMDRLYLDLNSVTKKETFESVHLADFPVYNEAYVDKSLERKMESSSNNIIISIIVKSKRKD